MSYDVCFSEWRDDGGGGDRRHSLSIQNSQFKTNKAKWTIFHCNHNLADASRQRLCVFFSCGFSCVRIVFFHLFKKKNEFSCERAHGWCFYFSLFFVDECVRVNAMITINGQRQWEKNEKRKTCCWCIFIDFRFVWARACARSLHVHRDHRLFARSLFFFC